MVRVELIVATHAIVTIHLVILLVLYIAHVVVVEDDSLYLFLRQHPRVIPTILDLITTGLLHVLLLHVLMINGHLFL